MKNYKDINYELRFNGSWNICIPDMLKTIELLNVKFSTKDIEKILDEEVINFL